MPRQVVPNENTHRQGEENDTLPAATIPPTSASTSGVFDRPQLPSSEATTGLALDIETMMTDHRKKVATLWNDLSEKAAALDAVTLYAKGKCIKDKKGDRTWTDAAKKMMQSGGMSTAFENTLVVSPQDQYDQSKDALTRHYRSMRSLLEAATLPGQEAAASPLLTTLYRAVVWDCRFRISMVVSMDQRSDRREGDRFRALSTKVRKEKRITRSLIQQWIACLSAVEYNLSLLTHANDDQALGTPHTQPENASADEDKETRAARANGRGQSARWGRLQLMFPTDGKVSSAVTDVQANAATIEAIQEHLPYVRTPDVSGARILDDTRMSEWPEIGPLWEHRGFPFHLIHGLQSHLHSSVDSYRRYQRSGSHHAPQKAMWQKRYVVEDEEILSCVKDGIIPFAVEQIQGDTRSRLESFLHSYKEEWDRKDKYMSSEALRFEDILSDPKALLCWRTAWQSVKDATDPDRIKLAIDSVLDLALSLTVPLQKASATASTEKRTDTEVSALMNDAATSLRNYVDAYLDAQQDMKELSEGPFGSAFREAMLSKNIKVPDLLRSLVDYLTTEPGGEDTTASASDED